MSVPTSFQRRANSCQLRSNFVPTSCQLRANSVLAHCANICALFGYFAPCLLGFLRAAGFCGQNACLIPASQNCRSRMLAACKNNVFMVAAAATSYLQADACGKQNCIKRGELVSTSSVEKFVRFVFACGCPFSLLLGCGIPADPRDPIHLLRITQVVIDNYRGVLARGGACKVNFCRIWLTMIFAPPNIIV